MKGWGEERTYMEYINTFKPANVRRLVIVRVILGPLQNLFATLKTSVFLAAPALDIVLPDPICSSSNHQTILDA